MIADDPLDDGESQAAALGLGGEAGDEQMRPLLGIDPGTLIGDRELLQVTVDSGRDRDARGFGAGRCPARAPGLGGGRLEAVLDQVDQRLVNLRAVGGEADVRVGPREDQPSRLDLGSVEHGQVAEDRRHAAGRDPRRREAAVFGELPEQPLEARDLLAHGAGRLVEDGRELRALELVAATEVGDRDHDRGEWILDLVRDLARHLAPRRLPAADHQPLAITQQVAPHAVERGDQRLQLADAGEGQRLVPFAAGQTIREGGEALHGSRDLGRPQGSQGDGHREADQTEQRRRCLEGGDGAIGGARGDQSGDAGTRGDSGREPEALPQVGLPRQGHALDRRRWKRHPGRATDRGRQRDAERVAQHQVDVTRLLEAVEVGGVEHRAAAHHPRGVARIGNRGRGGEGERGRRAHRLEHRSMRCVRLDPSPQVRREGARERSVGDHHAGGVEHLEKIQAEQEAALLEIIG